MLAPCRQAASLAPAIARTASSLAPFASRHMSALSWPGAGEWEDVRDAAPWLRLFAHATHVPISTKLSTRICARVQLQSRTDSCGFAGWRTAVAGRDRDVINAFAGVEVLPALQQLLKCGVPLLLSVVAHTEQTVAGLLNHIVRHFLAAWILVRQHNELVHTPNHVTARAHAKR